MSKLEEEEWPERSFARLAGRTGLSAPAGPPKLAWSRAKGGEPGTCL